MSHKGYVVLGIERGKNGYAFEITPAGRKAYLQEFEPYNEDEPIVVARMPEKEGTENGV